MAGKWSSLHVVCSARKDANINKVEDLTLSQKNEPQKQFTMENCSTN